MVGVLDVIEHGKHVRGVGQQQTDSGPSEPQIRAKDAGYILLNYTAAADRQELSDMLLEWILADLGPSLESARCGRRRSAGR